MGNNDLLLTWMPSLGSTALSPGEVYTVILRLKNPAKSKAFIAKHEGLNAPAHTNNELLRGYGILARDSFMTVAYRMAAVLIVIIMVGSVSLIHNAFAISVSERSRQFGILSSVGATKKQLAGSVLYEGAIIGAIGIPIGVVCGVAGIGITLRLVGGMITRGGATELKLAVSAPLLILAAVIAFCTILISAYIPAARAAKASAIDAIRQSADVTIKSKDVRGGKLTGRLFGLEGTLALKNFKRNKGRYRSTVFSLFISIVIFISAASFGLYLDLGQQGLCRCQTTTLNICPSR